MLDLVRSLNPEQREAVEYLDGPLMIIAGAGSGKTRVITYRIAFLARMNGIPLNQIMAVTFTNKAAKEMRERVCRILHEHDSPALPIGTFHSRCALILRREAEAAGLDPNFAILDENDQRQAIRRTLKDMDISEKRARPAQVQAFINQAKMRLLTPEDCRKEFDESDIPYADIYEKYQRTIEKNKSIDFEDLMMRTVLLFKDNEHARLRWANRYRYLLVDEYQDTNHAQFLLTKLLAQEHKNICVVGDEDQSIYSWRGAEVSNLIDFAKQFPDTNVKLIKLERNYRSTNTILRAANNVIAHNTQRIGKTLVTEQGEGDPLSFFLSRTQDDEGKRIAMDCVRLIQGNGIDPNNIAIFYRGHWLSRGIEDALRQQRLPYRVVGGMRFYDRSEIKDLLGFLRLAINPDDDLAFERVVNRPARGAGDKTMAEIAEQAAQRGVSLFKATAIAAEIGILKGKARSGLQAFVSAIYQWHAMAPEVSAEKVLERVLFDTNYKEDGLGDTTSIESESKLQNIEEFAGMLKEFEPTTEKNELAEFLTSMALDAAEEQDDTRPKISLLTIHNAKGLEFDYVYTIGMEQGVFPTSRSEESENEYALEEERRLFYVAITRARKKFTLSFSHQRNRPDYFTGNQPSQFLSELPPDVFDFESKTLLTRLLPYGWGQSAEEKKKKSLEREIVYDDDAAPRQPRPEPRQFARMTQGMGNTKGPIQKNGGKAPLGVGSRVEHRYMGEGVIVELGGRPGWERVTVQFDDGREQEFVLKYAPLKALG